MSKVNEAASPNKLELKVNKKGEQTPEAGCLLNNTGNSEHVHVYTCIYMHCSQL